MAELTLAPPRDRSPLVSVLIAALILAVIAAAIFFFIPRDTAKLSVTGVQIFSPRTEFKAAQSGRQGMNIIGQQATTEDDLYVVATVHLEDKFRMSLFVDGMSGALTLADGSMPDGSTVPRSDLVRLEAIFPALVPMLPHPIAYSDEIAPGKPLDGQIVLQFPSINAQAWQNKKSATLTLNMRNQPPLTVPIP